MSTELPQHGVELIRMALDWQEAVEDRDFDAVWQLMHPIFKTVVAQSWVINNPSLLDDDVLEGWSRDDVVKQIIDDVYRMPRGGGLLTMFMREVGRFDSAEWGLSQSVRVLAPDLEAVLFVDQTHLPVDEEGTSYIPADGGIAPVLPLFFSTHDGGPLVSGWGQYFEVGWPPVKVDVDVDGY